uniref:pre-rRNA processing protein FTSJ3 n=1 Tax=Electrophorus electricus TaxID=8005 RepID=A0A4W4FJZ5_ELEEL
MGKKLKVGKTRKDKFYHLAKETGYRSRSSFKLIQLNRKFQFLQKARALVDLCAAPGGWLQVASKFMPVSSLIIGVDLVPIRPIPSVVTLQEDITTEKCRQALRKELQTWKADVVLNDGAPNVGANWQHDAFSQAHLTLMALKLGCEFLVKGGTFVTKVFRSKDYQPLMWIFQQFFKKVQATKPQASRNESAEIFVVCQGFLAPDKIDNKFFDPKHAFKEVEVQVKTVKELVTVKKPRAEGYGDGDLTLYHTFSATEFLRTENPVDFLSKTSEITFDSPELESHPATSDEIKECCKDIKVLGRKELRVLLSWRSKLRRFLAKKLRQEAKQLDQEISVGSSEDESDTEKGGKKKTVDRKEEQTEEEEEEMEMEKKLAELKAEELAELKRKKKRLLKERRKQRERVELKMDLPGASIADAGDSSMFSLGTIKKAQVPPSPRQPAPVARSPGIRETSHGERVSFAVEEEEEGEGQGNSLLVELEGKDEKRERETSMWFSKVGAAFQLCVRVRVRPRVDFAVCDELRASSPSKRARILDAEGLAIGAQIAMSKKRHRDLVDDSFHRWAADGGEIPAWFVDDERKHRKRPVPVTREMVEEYKQKWREINARPIKRLAEAKARKKRRMLKKMEQAKKKAEAVVNTADVSEREKMAQLKSIYKKAGVGKEKRDVTYVVAKRGAGRKVARPPGVKGLFRVVDGRMKKDLRGKQRKEQGDKGKGGRSGGRGGRGGRSGGKGGQGVKTGKGRPNRK